MERESNASQKMQFPTEAHPHRGTLQALSDVHDQVFLPGTSISSFVKGGSSLPHNGQNKVRYRLICKVPDTKISIKE